MDTSKETIKLEISDLRPNMILARDVVSKSGVVILAKNTRLDKSNYAKLEKNEDVSEISLLFLTAQNICFAP